MQYALFNMTQAATNGQVIKVFPSHHMGPKEAYRIEKVRVRSNFCRMLGTAAASYFEVCLYDGSYDTLSLPGAFSKEAVATATFNSTFMTAAGIFPVERGEFEMQLSSIPYVLGDGFTIAVQSLALTFQASTFVEVEFETVDLSELERVKFEYARSQLIS